MYNWIKNTLMMTRSIQPISLTTTLTQTRSSVWTCLPRKCPSGSIGKHERYKNLCRAGISRWFAKDRIPLTFLSSSAVYHFSNHIYDQYFQGNRCSQNQVPCSWENWDNKTGKILMMTFSMTDRNKWNLGWLQYFCPEQSFSKTQWL